MKAFLRGHGPLLLIVAAVAVPLVRVGRAQYIEYDGWWHVFVSRAESLVTFYFDWHKTTQPPLYFLLLKLVSFLGDSLLAYRALSIAAGLASVFLVGKIAERVTSSRLHGVLAAAAFGFSTTTVILSCEVRSYTTAVAFLLLAFLSFLSIVRLEADRRQLFLFSAAVTAAVLTHYSAAFFLFAAILTPLVIAAFRPGYRTRLIAYVRSHASLLAASFAAPALLLAILYRHMRQWTQPLNYLTAFYIDPARESWIEFLLRGLRQEINLFSPVTITSPLWLIALLVIAVAALIVVLRMQDVSFATPVVLLCVLGSLVVLAALFGKYPLGGQLRHQFLLFPFIILAVVSLLGAMRPRGVFAALFAILICANAVAGYRQFQIIRTPLFQSEFEKLRTVVPPSTMLYVDEFSTIALFCRDHDWNWHLAASDKRHTLFYELTKGGARKKLVRIRNQWNFDPLQEALYRDVRREMDLHGERSAGLFAIRTIWPGTDTRAQVERAASAAGLTVDAILVDGRNLYARLSCAD